MNGHLIKFILENLYPIGVAAACAASAFLGMIWGAYRTKKLYEQDVK